MRYRTLELPALSTPAPLVDHVLAPLQRLAAKLQTPGPKLAIVDLDLAGDAVTLHNNSSLRLSLTGVTVYSESTGASFEFVAGMVLGAGQHLTLYCSPARRGSARGDADEDDGVAVHWVEGENDDEERSDRVFNKKADTVFLYDADGHMITAHPPLDDDDETNQAVVTKNAETMHAEAWLVTSRTLGAIRLVCLLFAGAASMASCLGNSCPVSLSLISGGPGRFLAMNVAAALLDLAQREASHRANSGPDLLNLATALLGDRISSLVLMGTLSLFFIEQAATFGLLAIIDLIVGFMVAMAKASESDSTAARSFDVASLVGPKVWTGINLGSILFIAALYLDHAHVQLALGHKTRLLAVPVLSELLLCACVAKQLSTFVVGYSAIQLLT